jgi:hypothetical protein
MRIPAIEALFAKPWTVAARRMLPSPSPHITATAMWGPILAWCALELLAESIDPAEPNRIALDVFDRLRLREPFAHAFAALGVEGEEGWRVAARIKVVLLTGAGVGIETESPADAADSAGEQIVGEQVVAEKTVAEKIEPPPSTHKPKSQPEPKPEVQPETKPAADTDHATVTLAPALWSDPDVRWLTGAHQAEGHLYIVREQYEQLLWWLLMPTLLKIAGEPVPNRKQIESLAKTVDEALDAAEAAGYRIDELLGWDQSIAESEIEPELKPEAEAEPEPEPKPAHPAVLDAKPVVPAPEVEKASPPDKIQQPDITQEPIETEEDPA